MNGFPTPLTRYWIKQWPNGKVTPQFKPDTAEEVPWGDKNSGMTGLRFVPFSPKFAEKIREKGVLAIPSSLPSVDIPLDPSETVRVRRLQALTQGSCYLCHNCKSMFDWQEPTPPYPACPKCGTVNHWYCDIHGQIDDPIFFDREEENGRTVTEARCPICSDPHGLVRSTDLEIVDRPPEFRVKYNVQVPGAEIEFDETNIKVLRSCLTNTTPTS